MMRPANLKQFHFVTSSMCHAERMSCMYFESTTWTEMVLACYCVVHDGFPPSHCLNHQTLNRSLNRKVRAAVPLYIRCGIRRILCGSLFTSDSVTLAQVFA